jgi:tripartite-type tricarboxylate transporter receptor subunit TctC
VPALRATGGADAVLKAGADGYTLLATADALASTPHLFKLSFDPMKDFVAIVQFSRQPVVLAAHPTVGVQTIQELVALARRQPGLAFATSGAGSLQHVAAEWFAQLAGIRLTHVPYKGGGKVSYEVRIGSLPSKLVAEALAARLRGKHGVAEPKVAG